MSPWFRTRKTTVTRSLLRTEPDISRSLDPFLDRLARTVAWCVHRADAAHPRECLRDEQHRPRPFAPTYFALVSEVASGRSRVDAERANLAGGRLLVYFPDADLSDGAAEMESCGFFDVFSTPPWDTWVAFAQDDVEPSSAYGRYLIAYVPPQLLELCNAGIEVNPEECIAWIENTDVAFLDRLRGEAPRLLWSDR